MKFLKRFFAWVKKPKGRIKRLLVLTLFVLDLYIVVAVPILPFRVSCSNPLFRAFSQTKSDSFFYALRIVLFRSEQTFTLLTNFAEQLDKWEINLNGGPIEPLIYETNVLVPISLLFSFDKLHRYSVRAASAVVREDTGLSVAELKDPNNNQFGYRHGKLGCEALFFIAAEGRAPTAEEASRFSQD